MTFYSQCRAPTARIFRDVALTLFVMLSYGCTTMGAKTIPRDQLDYGAAISDAWNEQLLTNIVRLRYVEAPFFVSLSSVINQYSRDVGAVAGGGLNTALGGDENTVTASGSVRYKDQPTITYVPLAGKNFATSLLTPIPPESLFALFQAGAAPEFVFRLALKSLNGVNNARASLTSRRNADPEFMQVLDAWKRLRDAGVIGFRRDENSKSSKILISHRPERATENLEADLAFVFETLGLDSNQTEFELVYGLVPQHPNQIAVLTSSIFDIMNELAWRIDVPEIDVRDGRTGETYRELGPTDGPLIRVYSSSQTPSDAFVSVRKRDNWFYISNRDMRSKRAFSLLQIMLNLTDNVDNAAGPTVSITN